MEYEDTSLNNLINLEEDEDVEGLDEEPLESEPEKPEETETETEPEPESDEEEF